MKSGEYSNVNMVPRVTKCPREESAAFGGTLCLICNYNKMVHCSYVDPICTYNKNKEE